jgi:hypothetical protein
MSRAPRIARAGAGAVDWGLLTALAANVTALAALLVAIAVMTQVRGAGESARSTVALQSLWRFVDEWNGPDMLAARGNAAASLLAERPARDVGDVLSFFGEIAFLLQRGVLDEEMVWYEFYWPLVSYWTASEGYVHQARRDDPSSWLQLSQLVPQLVALERRRHGRSDADAVPSKTQLREFLQAEVSSGECTEEDGAEVGRVPL